MNEQNDKYKYYLQDLGQLLKEYALEARAERDNQTGDKEREFYNGMVLGYHRVISLMQQQAEGFDIDLAELNLQDIHPDMELV